ncbi:hypothetical protein JCM3770_000349 [Rhodotorula araucariae]
MPAAATATACARARARAANADLEVSETTRSIYATALPARPKETIRKYECKQTEYLEWCKMNSFDPPTRQTVMGERVAAFIVECIVDRQPAPEPAHHEDAEEDAETAIEQEIVGKTGSSSVVEGYIVACIDLWRQQAAQKSNSHLNLNARKTPALTANIQVSKQNTAACKREEVLAGWVPHGQFIRHILAAAMARNTAELRDRLGMSLAHYGLLRLGNILSVELKREGPTSEKNCFSVVVLLDHGKTNKDGRKVRFHVAQEQFPPKDTSFPSCAESRNWFDLVLLRTSKGGVADKVK